MGDAVRVTCDVNTFACIDDLKEFQGELKELSKEGYRKLKKSILKHGFHTPIFVWENDGVLNILDGHQRKLTLIQMRTEGHEIPLIPIIRVRSESWKQAKETLLTMVSQYGKVKGQGLYEYLIHSEINIDDLYDSFEIPHEQLFNIDHFKQEYFSEPIIEEQGEELEQPTEEEEPQDIIPDKIEARVKEGEFYEIDGHQVFNGDCLEILKQLESNSLDSIVTDPPAGISFMGKAWDDDKGGSKEWITWLTNVMKECLRVLKPGAHGLVWAIPRTSHWTATALEDAGFEIRDVVTHLFGSGFPKSMNISIAIDKQAGVMESRGRALVTAGKGERKDLQENKGNWTEPNEHDGITSEAKKWQGWGTALKPASEHWILVRKPCSEKTVAANVLEHGVGGINIDASRIGYVSEADKRLETRGVHVGKAYQHVAGNAFKKEVNRVAEVNHQGRFPANLLFSHNPDCEDKCTEGCAVAMLDAQSGHLHAPGSSGGGKTFGSKTDQLAVMSKTPSFKDSGGASRFFYCAKPSKTEKNAVAPRSNFHPTVKPIKLMQYLINMITPPDGIILDCFGGSGTTLVAAHLKGFKSILIEQSTEYCDIILARAEFCCDWSARKIK